MCRFAQGKLLVAILLASAATAVLPAADGDLPYRAYVVVADTDVRSGPGESYYCTERLPQGAEVEVYRRDPGGWLAIRPPTDSFCWVPADKLQRTDQQDVAEVTAMDAVAWMGSTVESVQRHRWQVRLDPGERVAVLDVEAREDSATGQKRNWYKIAPPAGEFRWVHGDDVRRVRMIPQPSPVSDRAAAVRAAAVSAAAARTDRPATLPTTSREPPAPAAQPQDDAARWVAAKKRPKENRDSNVQAATHVTESPTAQDEPAPRRRGPSMALTERTNVLPAVAQETADTQAASDRVRSAALPAGGGSERVERPGESRVVWAPRSPRREAQQLDARATTASATADAVAHHEVSLERDDIELQLSLMVSRDPQLWNLAALRGRAEALLERAPTALERGQIRLLVEQIEDFEDLYERHVAAEKGVVVPASAAAPSESDRPTVASRVEPRFDGSGWLIPVHSVKRSAPPYAITDDGGKVVMYVTPAPGVNLHRYERKRVGIYGQRNSTQDLSVQVLTAHRVIDIDRHVTR